MFLPEAFEAVIVPTADVTEGGGELATEIRKMHVSNAILTQCKRQTYYWGSW